MAEYLIQDTTLTAIADAIREKTGDEGEIAVSAMAEKIGKIVASNTGGNLTLKIGSFTPGSAGIYTVTHDMGIVPDIVFVYPHHVGTNGYLISAVGFSQAMHDALGGGYISDTVGLVNSSSISYKHNAGIESVPDATSTAYKIGSIRNATATQFVVGGSTYKMNTKSYGYLAIGGIM